MPSSATLNIRLVISLLLAATCCPVAADRATYSDARATAANTDSHVADFDANCRVDFADFAVFASAWLSEDGQAGWNPDCDISPAADGTVDAKDLAVFVEYWLGADESNCPGNLFFSEYIEGSSYNKAIEICNAGDSDANLADYLIKAYHNGSSTPTYSIALDPVMLAPGNVFVLGHNNFSQPELCDRLRGNLSFNGDDTLELVFNEVTLDVIGQTGFDPGTYWGSGDITTRNHTLRRKCSVTGGDPNGSDVFDPATQWDAFAQDTFDGLGSHCRK